MKATGVKACMSEKATVNKNEQKIRMQNYREENIKSRHKESKNTAERKNKIQQIGDRRASNKKRH